MKLYTDEGIYEDRLTELGIRIPEYVDLDAFVFAIESETHSEYLLLYDFMHVPDVELGRNRILVENKLSGARMEPDLRSSWGYNKADKVFTNTYFVIIYLPKDICNQTPHRLQPFTDTFLEVLGLTPGESLPNRQQLSLFECEGN